MRADVRLGLVGAGRWGRNVVRTLSELSAEGAGVRLAAVASNNPQTRRLLPDDCELLPGWRELVESHLATGQLEGVIVATPPATHREIAVAALEHGVPVFVEKPLATSIAGAREIARLARSGGTPVLVDHVHLFGPAWRRLRELVAGRRVLGLRSRAGAPGPFREDVPVLWDWGPHDVAMALDLLGEPPARARARFRRPSTREGVVGERVDLELEWDSGPRCLTVLSNVLACKVRWMAVQLEDEVLVLDDRSPAPLVRRRGRAGEVVPVLDEPPLTAAIRAFATAIRTGREESRSLELGVQVVETLASCREQHAPAAALAG